MRVKSAWSNSEASGAVLRVHTEFPLPLLQPVEYLPSFGVSNIARIRAKWSGGAAPR